MARSPCRLTTLGIVSCLGRGGADTLAAVLRGEQGGFIARPDLIPGREVMVGAVSGELPRVPAHLAGLASRNVVLTLAAFEQIAGAVARAVEQWGRSRIGIVLGSSTSGIGEGGAAIEEYIQYGELPASFDYARQEIGTVSEALASYTGITGPAWTISTACSSSAKVFRSAQRLLEIGLCDAVIVGGVDTLCRMTLNGFGALELLSSQVCNPFSRNRNGITIGEGAALFLLTRESSGVQLLGVGESSDAHHMSSPDPEARGAIAALEQALKRAGVQPHEVSYLNLHGTGTGHNDAMESRAVAALFGTGEASVWCSSTKPLTGHTLGASGAVEAAICWLILEQQQRHPGEPLHLPPHIFDGELDPALPPLSFVPRGGARVESDRAICVSNSFGFGGSNCALVLGVER